MLLLQAKTLVFFTALQRPIDVADEGRGKKGEEVHVADLNGLGDGDVWKGRYIFEENGERGRHPTVLCEFLAFLRFSIVAWHRELR